MQPKKIVIAVNLDQKDQKPLDKLKNTPWMENAEVHFVYILECAYYGAGFTPYYYPPESEFPRIKKDVLQALNKLSRRIFPHTGQPKIVVKCLFEQDAKESFCKYAKSVKADMVIVATRGKKGIKGFFDSSFARYLSKYSPADLLILRP
jgi:nucleotide-binding universal stress UspA family protein